MGTKAPRQPPIGARFRRSIVADVLSLQALETLHRHVLNQREHLLLGILVFVPLTRHTHSHTPRHVPDTIAPDLLVELGVDAHVLRAHDLRGELANGPDRPGRPLLEGDLLHVLVEVNRVVPSGRLLSLALAAAGTLRHSCFVESSSGNSPHTPASFEPRA